MSAQAPQDTQSAPQTKMDELKAALEKLESDNENADVKARFKEMLRPTVKQVAAQRKAQNSAVTNEAIVDIVVAMLQQQGNNVLDEAALRQIIRQILVEEYPGSENAQGQNNDEQLNAQLKEQLRTIVKAIGQNLRDSGITLSDESIAERVIAKAKQNGWKIVDEAGMKQLILQLIAEEFPPAQNDPTSPQDGKAGADSPTQTVSPKFIISSSEKAEPLPLSPSASSSSTTGSGPLPLSPSASSSSPTGSGPLPLSPSASSSSTTGSGPLPLSPSASSSSSGGTNSRTWNLGDLGIGKTSADFFEGDNQGIRLREDSGVIQVNPGALRSADEALMKIGPSVVHQLTVEDNKPKMISGLKLTKTVEAVLKPQLGETLKPLNLGSVQEIFLTPTKTLSPANAPSSKVAAIDCFTISVLSQGEEVASVSYRRGAYIYDFDATPYVTAPEGMRLAGWSWHEKGSSKWMAKPATMPDVDLVVEANFAPKQYSVTCNGQTTMVNYGAALSNPAVTAPAGKALDHWEWRIAATNAVIPKPATMPNYNLVATPVWKDVVTAYTLTINGSASEVAPGTALTAPGAPTDAPEGYRFDHWKWTVGGVEASAMPATMPAANVTATPVWVKATYTLTINGEAREVEPGTALTAPGALTPQEGYSFDGWKWIVGGVEASTMPATMPDANVTATPIFTPNIYNLTVNGSTTQVAYGTPLSLTPPTAPEGHSFGGWKCFVNGSYVDQVPTTMPAGNVTAEPNFTPNSYNLVITNGFGTTLYANPCQYGATIPYPQAPAYDGKEFTGWSYTGTMPAYDLTINATWKDKEIIPDNPGPGGDGGDSGNPDSGGSVSYYKLIFDLPDGSIGPFELKAGDPIPYPNDMLPAGYAWNSNITVMPACDITITAVKPDL